jgi:hypothetical protein
MSATTDDADYLDLPAVERDVVSTGAAADSSDWTNASKACRDFYATRCWSAPMQTISSSG